MEHHYELSQCDDNVCFGFYVAAAAATNTAKSELFVCGNKLIKSYTGRRPKWVEPFENILLWSVDFKN